MTRFARARGSKSSNEKTPEEASSWLEMKNAVLQKPVVSENKSVQKVPETKQTETEAKNSVEWAPLEIDTVENNFSLIREHLRKNNTIADTKKKEKANKNIQSKNDSVQNNSSLLNKNGSIKTKKEKKKLQNRFDDEVEDLKMDVISEDIQNNFMQKKKRKLNDSHSEETIKPKKTNIIENITNQRIDSKVKKKKKNKETVPNKNVIQNDSENVTKIGSNKFQKQSFSGEITKKLMHSKNGEMSDLKIKKTDKKSDGSRHSSKILNKMNNLNDRQHDKNNISKMKSKFDKKKSKEWNEKQNTVEEIIVNGEKIKIVKFQGFNVMLDDAERLKKLRADMFREGIPRKKLEAALKLERRRAEKALARLKKAVCFHCRGLGHVLSECPSLNESQSTGTGICYKCGSTEHSAMECKVVKGSSFQFAECFICKEQGHIAKQCPDNPRGLYPHGGACRECGDVTHLRKDCPKNVSKKEEETMTVNISSGRNLESLDEEIMLKKKNNNQKLLKKKSVVKF